jgi:hypothetical protein
MDQARFAFQARALGGPLSLQVKLDNICIFEDELSEEWCNISHEFDDIEDTTRVIRITLQNKLPGHTQVNDNGDIVADRVIEIQNFTFDDVALGYVFLQNSVYEHNYNETGPDVKDEFYGTMGCNGTVSLEFQGPLYLWLLEHM